MSVKNKTMLRWAHLPECQSPPQGWIVSSFTKCAEVIAGQSPPSDTYNEKGQGLPFLQGNADFGYKYPMPKAWCTTPQKTAKKNDTLISVRAPVGEVNRADQSYVIGRGLAALRPIGIDTNFLFQAIQRWRFCLQRVAQGTTFDAVTARHFVQLHVAIPSLPEEQEAIARILDAVAMVIEQTRGAVERARVLKKSLVQHLFEKGLRGEAQHKTAIGLIPNSWRVVPVNAVVTQFQYGLSGEMSSKGKYPILRMGNIQAGEILFDDLKYIDLPEKIADTYTLKRGDVLFNRTNSQEHVGKVGIYRRDEQAVFASYLIRLFPNDSQVDRYYLGQLLGSYPAQCRIKRYATPGVQQVNVNAKNLGLVLIPVPPGEDGLQEQRDIAAILEQADERIRAYQPVLDTLADLKRALMHDLLTGKVRVNHAIDKILASEES